MKHFLTLVLISLTFMSLGCQNCSTTSNCCKSSPKPRFGPYENIDRSRIYGMGFPALLRTEARQFTPEQAAQGIELMNDMGVRSWRAWMHTRSLLSDPTTPRTENVQIMKDLIQLAQKYDIEIIGMNHNWFNGIEDSVDPNAADLDDVSIFQRDLTEGSNYMNLLAAYQTSWQTIASLFPEISLWEVGNEWNHDPFLHPIDYKSSGFKSVFTWKEKAAISTDLLYYASKGIHNANPNAKVILGGPAPVYDTSSLQIFKGQGKPYEFNITTSGIAAFLTLIYENIQSGRWPSKNNDDYFQILAWHPYSWDRQPGQWWVEQNNLVYQVAVTYGDEGKPVYFTEWGVTESGDPTKEEPYADYIVKAYNLIEQQMPYIKSMHYFRLYQDKSAAGDRQTEDWGGAPEVYYGMFTEPNDGHSPRLKAIKYQQAAQGKGNLHQFQQK